jgi:hypothetical protein
VRVLPAERRELIDALVAEADIGDITAGLLVLESLGYALITEAGAIFSAISSATMLSVVQSYLYEIFKGIFRSG